MRTLPTIVLVLCGLLVCFALHWFHLLCARARVKTLSVISVIGP